MAPVRTRPGRRVGLPLALLGALACGDAGPVAPTPDPPVVSSTSATVAPLVGLAIVVTVRASAADSVAISLNAPARPEAPFTAPSTPVTGDSAVLPVLGLHPSTTYHLVARVWGPGGTASGDTVQVTTNPLPGDLPTYSAAGGNPAPGFVVLAAGNYGIVIDNDGRVVWYYRWPNGPGLNFIALPNGHYAARAPTPDPGDIEPWVEIDPLGRVARTFGCANGLQARFHDVVLDTDGSYWLLCDETRTTDLTGHGGQAAARVIGTVVQRVAGQGELLFQWSPFDHFAITDLPEGERLGATVNWTHGNAIALDGTDGNLLLSFRSLNELTKVNVSTGQVMWRLGGLANQFALEGTPSPPFIGQHGLRPVAPGTLLLLDNRGSGTRSVAERYVIDEPARTARLLASYGSLPGAIGLLGGSVQETEGGRVLVSIGNGERVEEYDAVGNVVWRLEGGVGYVFRAQRIASLYSPGVGTAR